MSYSSSSSSTNANNNDWIRGVTVRGWLYLERWVSPYIFAVNSCQLSGDFCWYPDQLGAPSSDAAEYKICDLYHCHALLQDRSELGSNIKDYPHDEVSLQKAFYATNKDNANIIGSRYMEYHFDNFLTRSDILQVKSAGITHLKVPIPHYILQNDNAENEPWLMPANRWLYLVRLVSWCRQSNLQVWLSVQTVPGASSEDSRKGCLAYMTIQNTIKVLESIAAAIARDGLEDVVTGLGVDLFPNGVEDSAMFQDCEDSDDDMKMIRDFYDDALSAIRKIAGSDMAVFIGDVGNATMWNDGDWWLDEMKYHNTYLKSQYYHVYSEQLRELTPRQHIAYVCGQNHEDTVSCCYDDTTTTAYDSNTAKGISRIIDFSAGYTRLPQAKTFDIMKQIQKNGIAPEFDRTIKDAKEQEFVTNFIAAQMVAFEAASEDGDPDLSRGWFFNNLKMEGGAMIEWDFLRAIKADLFPTLASGDTTSQELFGTCESLIFKVSDGLVNRYIYPLPNDRDSYFTEHFDETLVLDDDIVVTHGNSLLEEWKKEGIDPDSMMTTTKSTTTTSTTESSSTNDLASLGYNVDNASSNTTMTTTATTAAGSGGSGGGGFPLFAVIAFAFFGYSIYHVFFKKTHHPNHPNHPNNHNMHNQNVSPRSFSDQMMSSPPPMMHSNFNQVSATESQQPSYQNRNHVV